MTEQRQLNQRLTAAAERLLATPGVEAATVDDPRFSEALAALDTEATGARDLAERLAGREQDPPDPAHAAEAVERLVDQLTRLPGLTVEQELTEIFAADAQPRNRDIVVGYYGWADGRQHTLTEIGRRFDITRERTRQVCAKLTRRFQHPASLWAPAMDRALELIAQRVPCPAERFEGELIEHGLTRVGMSLEAVATGAKLLGRVVPFELVTIGGPKRARSRLAVAGPSAEAASTAADVARREIYYHGIARIGQIRAAVAERLGHGVSEDVVRETLQLLDGFCWLDQTNGWFRITTIAKHGLPKTVDKILAVAGEIEVGALREAMSRNRRLWSDPPSEKVLMEFCRRTPGVHVEGRRIWADPPKDWRRVLTGIEAKLVRTLKKHGPVADRGKLEDLCVSDGMNRFSFHAFLAWSPVIEQFGHSIYGLLGSQVSTKEVKELGARRRAERVGNRVLEDHGRTRDGRVWLKYRLSKAASTYAVITIPAALKDEVEGRFELFDDAGEAIGTLATKDGRAWGLGAFLRRQGAEIGDEVMVVLDLDQQTAEVTIGPGD